jgi:SpoVK/Ycf46/Vps4 family AAA+-type ATPase
MSEIFGSLQTLMVDHIRLSLMSQIQKGNTTNIAQLIVLAIVVGAASWLYESFTGDGHKGWKELSFDLRSYVMRKHSIVIEGKHVTGIDNYSRRPITLANTFSRSFRSILFEVVQRIDSMKDVRELKEFATNVIKGEHYEDKNNEDVKTIFTVSQRTPFLLDEKHQIYCIVRETGEMREDGASISKTESRIIKFTISVFSYKSNVSIIKEYLKTVQTNYSKYLEDKRRGKLFVYTLNNTEVHNDDDDDTVGGWRETPHETMKSFDNIFFEGKQEVMNKIRFFTENKEWYRKNGVPYTLGIALYGEPGTGKTSFIKALATLLNRHIISMSLARIKTKKQLYDFYFETQYSNANDKNAVGFDKKIIVFEDIDCVGDIILKREAKTKTDDSDVDDVADIDDFVDTVTTTPITPEEKVKHEISKATKMVLKKMNGKEGKIMGYMNSQNQDSITLDDILNLWDGIRENTGRIMIITTNHYDRLDPALIRPGRIDMALNLGNATRGTIAEMYLHYYGTEIDPNDLALIPDMFYSPAEVINFYVSNHENPSGFVERLVSARKI